MMKARLGDGTPERIAVPVLPRLEGDDEVEGPLRDLARAGRDDARRGFAFRHADSAFVRVRGEVFDAARRRRSVAQEFVQRLDGRDALVVAVAARMVVRPGDFFRILIVALVARLVRVLVFAVKEVCAPDAAQGAERRPEVLMIARG